MSLASHYKLKAKHRAHGKYLKGAITMRYYEFAEAIIKPKKPLTPDQSRVASMQNQVKTTQKAIKAEKARQKIKAGQQQLAKIN